MFQLLIAKFQLRANYDWRPLEGYSQVATFTTDEDVQVFIELEEGKATWKKLLTQREFHCEASCKDKLDEADHEDRREVSKAVSYYPYEWMVRHFLEGDAAEVNIFFYPDGNLNPIWRLQIVFTIFMLGKAYGFEQTLPEDEEGLTIQQEDALRIAEQEAKKAPWNVDFELYDRVEASHVLQLGGECVVVCCVYTCRIS